MERLTKWAIGVGICLTLALLFYCLFLNHIDINEVGVAYNSIGGKVWIQDRPGWYLTSPFVEVATISTLPMKVTIPSEAKVINTKIVRFNPVGVDQFIRMQGFSYFTNHESRLTFLIYGDAQRTGICGKHHKAILSFAVRTQKANYLIELDVDGEEVFHIADTLDRWYAKG